MSTLCLDEVRSYATQFDDRMASLLMNPTTTHFANEFLQHLSKLTNQESKVVDPHDLRVFRIFVAEYLESFKQLDLAVPEWLFRYDKTVPELMLSLEEWQRVSLLCTDIRHLSAKCCVDYYASTAFFHLMVLMNHFLYTRAVFDETSVTISTDGEFYATNLNPRKAGVSISLDDIQKTAVRHYEECASCAVIGLKPDEAYTLRLLRELRSIHQVGIYPSMLEKGFLFSFSAIWQTLVDGVEYSEKDRDEIKRRMLLGKHIAKYGPQARRIYMGMMQRTEKVNRYPKIHQTVGTDDYALRLLFGAR
jgi:hypothetical protein